MSNKNKTDLPGGLNKAELDALLDATTTVTGIMTKSPKQLGKTAKVVAEIAKNQFKKIKDRQTRKAKKAMTSDEAYSLKEGGLAEATAKLKAKGFEDGGMVVKDKVVAIDTSPNSGLITTKGFGAGRKT
jgi:hypothetical protein